MTDRGGARGCRHDLGREAVYAAEESAFGGTDLEDPLPLADLRVRTATVVDGAWWTASGGPPVDVVAARGDARSSTARHHGPAAQVRLAGSQLDVATVAHELAHVLAGIEHGHDERFRTAHVDVVAMLSGSAPAASLASSYRAFGLELGPRNWPPPARVLGDTFVIVP
jgi:hypothetical protein